MLSQIAYQCDRDGTYLSQVSCQESPLEPGVWLVPANALLDAPPTIPEGHKAVYSFTEHQWTIVPLPPPPAPQFPDPAEPIPFDKLPAHAKREQVIAQIQTKLNGCQKALEDIQWLELTPEPASDAVKLAWINYRKALSAPVTQTVDWFDKLPSLAAFPFPVEPPPVVQPAPIIP